MTLDHTIVIRTAEEQALEDFEKGFHCAEAVFCAVARQTAEPGEIIPAGMTRLATAFGGGVGRSHTGMCGARTGGVMAIGLRLGRTAPGLDWTPAAEIAAEFQRRFVEAFGDVHCAAILARLEPQEKMAGCKALSARAAGILTDLLLNWLEQK